MTTQTWMAGTTGLWTTDTDWSPGPAPGEGDTALVTLPGNDLIEIPGDVFVESVVLDDVGATFAISGTLIVDKTLAIAAGEVDVAGSLSAGDLSNAGTIRNSGFVTVGTIDTASLERITGGEVDIDGTLENSGSTLDVSDLSSSPLILNWGLIEGGVVVDLLVDVSATLDAVTLEGTLTNRGYVGIENGLSVIGSGGIFADGGTFAFAGTADLDVNLSGSGTIIAVDALTIAAAVSVTEAPGGFTNGISGLVFNGRTIVNNGTILGTSTSGDGTDEIHDGLIAVRNGDFENFGVVDVADASPEVSQVGNPAAREGFARTSITAGTFDNEVGAVIETGEAFGTGSITIEAATAFTNDGLLSTWDQVASRGGVPSTWPRR